MKEKYYTPEIEDIKVGYEFERIIDDDNSDDVWIKDIIKFEHGWLELPEDYNERIRVPYLTKEQIEAEGWEFKSQLCSDEDCKDFEITYGKELNEITVYFSILQNYNSHIWTWSSKDGTSTLYRGECKSVNEFRTICKWLKI